MAESQDVAMDVEPQQYDPTRRNDALKVLFILSKYLHKKFTDRDFKIEVNGIIDLDMSNNISGVLHTVFTYMRKQNNPNAQARGNDNGDKNATVGNLSFTIRELTIEFQRTHPETKFDFKIATPIMDMLTSFKCMWSEIRMSCGKFEVRVDGKKHTKKLFDYGLDNASIPYLTGITFKPERRTGLIQTLGPLAVSILLANENRYTDKLERALHESLRMLPMASAIIECLKGLKSASAAGGLFKALSLILMLVESRQHHKMHCPLFFLMAVADNEESFYEKWNFSEVNGIKVYNENAHKYKWEKKSSGISEHIAQVVFHSIFGTAKEDLSLLEQVTTCSNYCTRHELNNVFTKAQSAQSRLFTPIRWTYIRKLPNANMMKNLGTLQPQVSEEIILSGARKRNYSTAFLEYCDRESHGTAYSTNLNSLIYEMKAFKDKYLREARQGKLSDVGTVKWLAVREDSYEQVEDTFGCSSKFFYV